MFGHCIDIGVLSENAVAFILDCLDLHQYFVDAKLQEFVEKWDSKLFLEVVCLFSVIALLIFLENHFFVAHLELSLGPGINWQFIEEKTTPVPSLVREGDLGAFHGVLELVHRHFPVHAHHLLDVDDDHLDHLMGASVRVDRNDVSRPREHIIDVEFDLACLAHLCSVHGPLTCLSRLEPSQVVVLVLDELDVTEAHLLDRCACALN